MKSLKLAVIAVTLILAFGITAPTTSAQTDRTSTKTNIDDLTAEVVQIRDLAAGYVSIARNSFDKKSPEFVQAQKLYVKADADNNAWNAYVKSALQNGHAKHLNNDEKYDKVSQKAAASAAAFVQYVDDKTKPQTKAVLTILSSLADLGIKLWTGISDKITKDRTTAATNFENATKWKSWDELVGSPTQPSDSPKPSPAGTPNPPTP